MEKTIKINSKEYNLPKINFGTICKLEEVGINFADINDKTFNFIRGLVAYTIGCDLEKATEEIDNHISSGGSVNDLLPLIEAVTNSDFFQSLAKKSKK